MERAPAELPTPPYNGAREQSPAPLSPLSRAEEVAPRGRVPREARRQPSISLAFPIAPGILPAPFR